MITKYKPLLEIKSTAVKLNTGSSLSPQDREHIKTLLEEMYNSSWDMSPVFEPNTVEDYLKVFDKIKFPLKEINTPQEILGLNWQRRKDNVNSFADLLVVYVIIGCDGIRGVRQYYILTKNKNVDWMVRHFKDERWSFYQRITGTEYSILTSDS
jgi:hypothetical protein